MESWKVALLGGFSDLPNNKNLRSYRGSSKAKNRVFCTFRLGLLKNLTWWSNSDPGFGFRAQIYFGNILQLFQNKTMQTCVICVIHIKMSFFQFKSTPIKWIQTDNVFFGAHKVKISGPAYDVKFGPGIYTLPVRIVGPPVFLMIA